MEPGTRRPLARFENDYQIDRDVQKDKTFSGIQNASIQDQATQETMGPIYDRSGEHLGSADSAIIMMRKQIMRLARELQEGKEPYAAGHGKIFRLRSAGILLHPGTNYVEASTPVVRVGAP